MSERLTEQRLAEIRARADAATRDRWVSMHDDPGCRSAQYVYAERQDDPPNGPWVEAGYLVALRPHTRTPEHWAADAAFIAAARADIPLLLGALAEKDHLLAVLAQDSEAERDGFRRGLAAAREIVLDEIRKWQGLATSERLKVGFVRGLGVALDRIHAAAREAGDAVPLALDEVRQDNERLRAALRETLAHIRRGVGHAATNEVGSFAAMMERITKARQTVEDALGEDHDQTQTT